MGFLSKAKYSCLNGDVLKLRRDDYFEPATPLRVRLGLGLRLWLELLFGIGLVLVKPLLYVLSL
jgi:hypothetical protein